MNRPAPADISLYIPVRNAARTLSAAIESVRAQRIAPAEFFLVVDTRSTDDSLRIARESGLRIVEQTDGRLGHARNLAIRACRTPWLASCDSDVALEPGWLEVLLAAADDEVAAVGGCTHERLITDADRWRAVNLPHNWGPTALDNPFMLVSEMLANVAALRGIGGYRADLQSWEDSDCCQRLRHAGHRLRYEPAAVAWHDRRDSVESVLDLRWFYASYRQRARFESLPGLVEKLAINRTYCLQGLSQTLHSDHHGVVAIGLLLWFHHARKDLAAALGHWPLLAPEQQSACIELLDEATLGCLDGPWLPLRAVAPTLLPTLFGRLRPAEQSGSRHASRAGLAGTRGFRDYAVAAHSATRALLAEICPEVAAILLESARRLTTPGAAPGMDRPRFELSAADRRQLVSLPARAVWNPASLDELLRTADCGQSADYAIVEAGRMLDAEQCRGGRSTDDTCPQLVLIPHLERSDAPGEALLESLESADAAVIAYQPPGVFIPAVPVLTARDLAALCAEAGFQIRHFHTEAGLSRLIVKRPAGASRARPAVRARAAAAVSA